MRKIILFNLISLDGFFEGPNREIDWHNVDSEFNQFATDQLNSADTLVFGRRTYNLMASYWPTKAAINDDPIVAGLMNGIDKIVFSHTLKSADWQNTRLINNHPAAAIASLKNSPGKDIFIFGSSDLAVSLLPGHLIDEIRLMVNPILLGSGRTMFNGLKNRVNLKLIGTRTFKSGNVLLFYQPIRKE